MTNKRTWIYDLLFILVLLIAGALRLTGLNWGEGYHQHPDELFLSGVLENLRAHACIDPSVPVDACPSDEQRWLTLGEIFDTSRSTLNPYNRGQAFFVYGNLPFFIIRYTAEMTSTLGLNDLKILSRQFSALADLFTIFFLYLLVSRLYGQRVGLLASLFSALTVMQIQQSHFFTTDLFMNMFIFLAIWFAVEIMLWKGSNEKQETSYELQEEISRSEDSSEVVEEQSSTLDPRPSITGYSLQIFTHPLFLLSIGFGVALGMAMASKINAAPLALLLPGAFAVRYLTVDRRPQTVDTVVGHRSSVIPDYWLLITVFLIAGGLATIISFRVFQPYAFQGLGLNPQWISNIQEQRLQATGEADLPWNLQWARRSHLYSFENLTLWGLGLPLGILAWAGFLLMGWRILQGEWRHLLLWGWTAFYFTWQSLAFNPTMRYQLPVYPLLAMMAAWFVFELAGSNVATFKRTNLRAVVASLFVITVLALTAVWAFAFHSIYLRPEPRMAASRWIYENAPGPINLQIETDEDGTYNQPLPFPTGINVRPTMPYQSSFIAQSDGLLQEILFAHVAAFPASASSQLYLTVWQNLNDAQPLASTLALLPNQDTSTTVSQVANFDPAPVVIANQTYYLKFELAGSEGSVNVCGAIGLFIQTGEQTTEQLVNASGPCTIAADNPYIVMFVPQANGTLNEISLEHTSALDAETNPEPHTINLFISREPNSTPEQSIASASVTQTSGSSKDSRGDSYILALDQPIAVQKGTQYYLRLETDSGILSLSGAAIANETDYDWSLPFRIDGYDPFGGMYSGDLNLQVYFDDNEDKLNRFVDILSRADYIVIPTNHQYAQITRLPERYPLTTLYYRELIGCPPQDEIIECYRSAKPGQYKGNLGFELAQVFESYPTLGPLVINDQRAEEAFTFYDHPKVLIFKKTDDFSAENVHKILSTVDLSAVVHLTPLQFSNYRNLMLPSDRLMQQRAGGTWSDLFDYDWVQNQVPIVGLLVWYTFIFLLGIVVYPIVRLALPGLGLYGYPVSRALGLVLLAWLSWMGGSLGVPYTRVTIGAALALITVAGLSLGWTRRDQFKEEWRTNRGFFVLAEVLFVSFFVIDLLIRLGNPDMWHPAKGGERPMDFSYFNAVLKSTSFPPYDPWFAGGYINYYYYGFVLVGTPVKLLGIVPTIAYNFILPTLFAMVAVGAFTVGWNLLEDRRQTTDDSRPWSVVSGRLVAGLAASVMMVLIGNLGTVQMVFQGFQRMAAPGGIITDANIVQRWSWALKGFFLSFGDAMLPIGRGEWYWNPSRVIPPGPGNEITEFPLFTFLYSDLHAHMIVLPVTLFILAWTVSFLKARAHMSLGEWTAALLVGGLTIGALKPMNTWDLYTYFPLAALAMIYTILRHFEWRNRLGLPEWLGRALLALGSAALVYILGALFYAPFSQWFSQAYNSINFWSAPYTPFWSYLTHWGLFIFIIVAWLTWETREWMASTPLSALNKLLPYMIFIELGLAVFLAALVFFAFEGISIGFLALPLAAWAGILLLRPGQPGVKRGVLLMIGTAFTLTLAVEKVALAGDIGRMNTVFKLYLQGWTLLAVSSAAAFGWLFHVFPYWLSRWRNVFQGGLSLLMIGAFMFTITATTDKIEDRMNPAAPHTLDSMTYMNYSEHWDGETMDLSEDYRAIRWMQDNVEGSPVIVEAHCTEYRWCTRFTIYTGLPGVVGWNWHQRQQRVFMASQVESRVQEISAFYTTPDIDSALTFLEKYQVKYIVVGQLERNIYPVVEGEDSLAKFAQHDGTYWRSVYRDARTVIYEVLP